jgi:hypothetical protein
MVVERPLAPGRIQRVMLERELDTSKNLVLSPV